MPTPDSGEGSSGGPAAALQITHLSKTFPGTVALDDVSLAVPPGTFHALLGGNGSGKSTLIKVLAGVYRADAGGSISVDGADLAADKMTPEHARSLNLHFVHQNLAIFPGLSVAENIAVGTGFETTRVGSIRWKAVRRRTAALIERFAIPARPDTLVRSLRPAEQAMVAIARALQDQEGEHTGVLVLDEPTASLPRAEVTRLMAALVRYAQNGQTILFVSHRLDEVIGTADGATVLRDGRLAGTLQGDEITEARLIELIVGRPLDRVFPDMPEVTSSELALEVRSLRGGPLRDVSFGLRRGEALGIAGLLGSGRSELLKMIFGAYHVAGGDILVSGRPRHFAHIGDAMRDGIAYVPEDRGREAAFPDMTVAENMTAAIVNRYWKGGRLRHREVENDARAGIQQFLVQAASQRQELSTLSGGNQQKVILARWLRRKPKILLLDEPTQGVDISARAEIYALVRQAVDGGCSVIIVTSDFEELSRVSDRVLVLNHGRVVAEVNPPDISPTRLTELAFTSQEATAS